MKQFLLFLLILTGAGRMTAQTVSSLAASGNGIKWYSASTGGTLYTGSEALVNGQHYYASQTVGGIESSSRLDVTATVVTTPVSPTTATHTPLQTQITWNWNTVIAASGYKWSATNNSGTATDMATAVTKTETGLTCGTSYTRYIWAYTSNCVSASATTLTQSTVSCVSAPSVTTSAASAVGSTSATLNGNITAANGENATIRGFKYSTTEGFIPSSAGTDVPENGSFGTGTFVANLSGLATTTNYFVRAYATNSAGTTYGDQVSFNTLIQTDFTYTGGVQTFIVPSGVTSVTIEAWGAQGGTYTNAGGLGGYATGAIAVTSGQILYVFVGQQPTNSSGGFNGGGDGKSDVYSRGGGGASDVRVNGTVLNDRIIVAAGGGGATNQATETGGYGGGLTGGDGAGANGTVGDIYSGHGATQTNGGAADDVYGKSTPGTFGQGGSALLAANSVGGGGGGGWYGGGAGDHGGGGGGSSYTRGDVTSGSTTSGLRLGNGRILISY